MLRLVSLLFILLAPVLADPGEVRQASLGRLNQEGFKVAPSLPLRPEGLKLRPTAEIESRMESLRNLIFFVTAPPEIEATVFKERADRAWLTADERAILDLSASEAKRLHFDQIGWTMEQMWGLAWVLGFEHPPGLTGQLQGDVARQLVFEFRPERSRSLARVIAMEDLFYCAHNAVRSAQLGHLDSVPPGYDPLAEGGGVAERRHALTWCLSPGVSWEDTDLST